MALGKNLKKKKLIPEAEAKSPAKKKAVKKTKLLEKKTTKEPAAKKTKSKTISKKKQPTVVASTQVEKMSKHQKDVKVKSSSGGRLSGKLFHFITEKTLQRRLELRKKYLEEIKVLQNQSVQLIAFEIGSEKFAVDIHNVKEIVPTPRVAAMPGLPDYFKGAVVIRQKTVTVMDLGEKLRTIGGTQSSYTLVLKDGKSLIGLLLAHLPSTLKVEGKNISGSLQDIEKTSRNETFIKGIIKLDNQLLFYLDVAELINSDRAIIVPDQLLKAE